MFVDTVDRGGLERVAVDHDQFLYQREIVRAEQYFASNADSKLAN